MPTTGDPRECPKDLDAERGLLGQLIVDPDCDVSLPKDWFIATQHRMLYGLIQAIRADGQTVTPEAVAERLPSRSRRQREQELQYLEQIVEAARKPTNGSKPNCAAELLARINDAWARRELFSMANTAKARALDPEFPWRDAVAALDASYLARDFSQTRFPHISAREFNRKSFQQRYLIPGVLAAGEAGGIYGPFKTLKTSCACDLLISVATGTPFLGHFTVAEPGPVMLLTGETRGAALQSLLRRVCRAHRVDLGTIEGFHVCTEMPDLLSRTTFLSSGISSAHSGSRCWSSIPRTLQSISRKTDAASLRWECA